MVWRQEEVVRTAFYWLEAPIDECRHQAMLVAEYQGNTINILRCDYSRLTVCLNDQMVDLDQPITICYQGKNVFQGKVKRTIAHLQATLDKRGDLRYSYPVVIEVKLLTRNSSTRAM